MEGHSALDRTVWIVKWEAETDDLRWNNTSSGFLCSGCLLSTLGLTTKML